MTDSVIFDTFSFLVQVTWLETDLFTLGLGFLMLSMGLTLKFEDFRRCLRNPWTVRTKKHFLLAPVQLDGVILSF